MTRVREFVRSELPRFLEELSSFLAFPSISASPERAPDMRRCAEWVFGELSRIGFEDARLLDIGGHPLVYAEWLHAPMVPTLLVYGHYDVQPPEPLGEWHSPPFEATVRDGRIYARGATDDKGQLFAHLKAIEAHFRCHLRLPVNMKVLIEGEEEAGHSHLDAFVRENPDLLSADVVVVSDTARFAQDVPSICIGCRGILAFEIELRGGYTDIHSGSFGGAIGNPACELARMLASLKDAAGRITIPGFYDAVRPLTHQEQERIAELPFDEAAFRNQLGVLCLAGEPGYTVLERLWTRPTLDINGLISGHTSPGLKTIIPSKALAKVSMRLVPDQDPGAVMEALEAYVKELTPVTMTMAITARHAGKPWAVGSDHGFMRAAARAMEEGFGTEPLYTQEGGSNPVIATLSGTLGVPVIMMSLGSPADNPHGPNESFAIKDFEGGIISAARFYTELGAE